MGRFFEQCSKPYIIGEKGFNYITSRVLYLSQDSLRAVNFHTNKEAVF